MKFCERLPATREESLKYFAVVGSKLSEITNPTLRSEALFRFQHLLASSAVFDDEPKRYPQVVREAFDALLLLLKRL